MKRRAQGEGSVFFDPSRGRWVGSAEGGINPTTGKRRRVRVIGPTQKDVAARLRERIGELETLSPAAPRTVGALVESWLSKGAPKRMSERTLTMVRIMVRNHLCRRSVRSG